jgi:hypothetical protein
MEPNLVLRESLKKRLDVVCIEADMSAPCVAGFVVYLWFTGRSILYELYIAIAACHKRDPLFRSRSTGKEVGQRPSELNAFRLRVPEDLQSQDITIEGQ